MRIQVLVKPNSRREGIERLPDGSYRISIHAPAHGGQANEAVVRALAEFFGVPKSRIRIVRGASGRRKLIEIL